MPATWWFKQDPSSTPASWTWRSVAVDGSILNQSAPFPDYGHAVTDALRHGFRPTEDSWAIETAHSIARFKHGQHSAFIPKTDPAARPPDYPAEVKKRSTEQEE
jgi:hypothetical protein